MNKFILIPYEQHTSFKSYLMKKEDDLSTDTRDFDKSSKNNVSSRKTDTELDKEKVSNVDILEGHKEQMSDNENDNQSEDKKLFPPPGIRVKKEKEKKYRKSISLLNQR